MLEVYQLWKTTKNNKKYALDNMQLHGSFTTSERKSKIIPNGKDLFSKSIVKKFGLKRIHLIQLMFWPSNMTARPSHSLF